MKPIKIAFAGAGGYANYCLGLLLDYLPQADYELVGIADPFAINSPRISYFRENNIPLFDTVEELFAAQEVDALYVASPISFHKQQCEAALKQGCAILCEKPLTPTLADTLSLREQWARVQMPFSVGFQWSFAPPLLEAKKDILAGKYGKAKFLKAYISWQRFDEYYETSSWKGRIVDAGGHLVNDSVVTNATAHYLHNIFFMMGESLEQSAMPLAVKGSVYRAKPIESFDSCFLKGILPGGAGFLFLATHSGDQNKNPIVEYVFENGMISIDANSETPLVQGILDGKEIVYGSVSTPESDSEKMKAFLASVRENKQTTCPIDAVLPHQTVCEEIFSQLTVQAFPEELVFRTSQPNGWFVNGLCGDLEHCFASMLSPEEAGFGWAQPELQLDLSNSNLNETGG